MKQILIVGAGGFVGRHLVQECKKRNIEFFEITRKDYDSETNKLRPNLLKDFVPTSVIFCLGPTPARNLLDMEINLLLAFNMVEEISSWQIELEGFTYISSDAVYGGNNQLISVDTKPYAQDLHGAMHLSRE